MLQKYKSFVIICGGIGVSPVNGILHYFLDNKDEENPPASLVHFIWSIEDKSEFVILNDFFCKYNQTFSDSVMYYYPKLNRNSQLKFESPISSSLEDGAVHIPGKSVPEPILSTSPFSGSSIPLSSSQLHPSNSNFPTTFSSTSLSFSSSSLGSPNGNFSSYKSFRFDIQLHVTGWYQEDIDEVIAPISENSRLSTNIRYERINFPNYYKSICQEYERYVSSITKSIGNETLTTTKRVQREKEITKKRDVLVFVCGPESMSSDASKAFGHLNSPYLNFEFYSHSFYL